MSANPVLWHKMESAGNSEIGVNPTFYGSPSFTAGKFGNGMYSDSITKYAVFPDALPMEKGSISVWHIPFVNVGVEPPGQNGHNGTHVILQTPYTPGKGQCSIYVAANGTFYSDWYLESSPGVQWSDTSYYGGTTLTYHAGDLCHFGATWDATAASTHKFKFYFNGVDCNVPLQSGDSDWTGYPGGHHQFWTDYHPYYGSTGVIDNLKVYDYAVTDNFAWDIAHEGLEGGSSRRRKVIIN